MQLAQTTIGKTAESFGLAAILTILSYTVGHYAGWITELNLLEVFAVFTSYSCTWLCTRQSRWNYPIGVMTTAAYSLLFYQWELPALALFNLYLVGSLIYGWFRWGADGNTRPVTTITWPWLMGYISIGLIIAGAFVGVNYWWDPASVAELKQIDIMLAAASGVAQLMLDNKKLENWTLWALINIVSIPYFLATGLTLVAFQYVFFLINTFIARRAWRATMPTPRVLTSEELRDKFYQHDYLRL